jgi:HAD superfamily hydrolase (TIGR01509 family)
MSATRQPEAIIFDCDGVLFDSAAANLAFYNAILAAMDEPPITESMRHHVNALSSPQVLEELFRHAPQRRARASEIASTIDYGPFFELMVPARNLRALLGGLRRRYRIAMATNRGRTIPQLLIVFDLADAFDAVVGHLDVPRPKPHPDMLIECARRLGIACDAALYVGDSPEDEAAAAAAGMRFVAVGDRCGHRVRIDHVGELPGLLGHDD